MALYPSILAKDAALLKALRLNKPKNGWKTDGLCGQTDPEVFFPEKGGSTIKAREICSNCPVASDCLASAIISDEQHGIHGGKSIKEIKALRKQAKDKLADQTDVSDEDCAS